MNTPKDFTLFPKFPVDVRLLIWELAFIPRVFALRPERYDNPVDPTAVSQFAVGGYRPRNENPIRVVWSGRFIPAEIPSHAVFQVSKESRHFAFSSGYRTWTMQERGGVTRNMIWCPSKDIILLPRSPRHHQQHEIPSINWLRMFAAQYPQEITVAENVALHTSIWHKDHRESNWISGQLFKFVALQNLVIVIDHDYEEALIQELRAPDSSRRWGPWKIPESIVEALDRVRLKRPDQRLPLPNVRVVRDTNKIIGTSQLEVTLR